MRENPYIKNTFAGKNDGLGLEPLYGAYKQVTKCQDFCGALSIAGWTQDKKQQTKQAVNSGFHDSVRK